MKDIALASDPSRETARKSSPRTDPIGAEIAVTVHASRYSTTARQTGKHLPAVHEETQTVIVFPQGAVVRLSAILAPGEPVVLTNRQSGADVLCRVVTVKSQPGIQSYVDLEFTQRAPGFWGQCFPAESYANSEVPAPPAVPPATATMPAEPVARRQTTSPTLLPEAIPLAVTVKEPAISAPPPALPALSSNREGRPVELATNGSSGSSIAVPTTHELARLRTATKQTRSVPLQSFAVQPLPKSKKVLPIAAAAVAVVSVALGGIVLWHQRSADAPPQTASTAAVVSVTPPTAVRPQDADVTLSQQTSSPGEASLQAPALPEVANLSAKEETSAPGPAVAKQAIEPSNVLQTPERASRFPKVAVGKFSRPIARKPALPELSEPTPVLTAQGNVLPMGNGLLPGAGRDPVAPPPAPALATDNREVPKLISSRAPIYPPIARARGVEGVVLVDILIDQNGSISEMKVLSGPPLLTQSAIDALSYWKYAPVQINGQPVAVHTQVSVSFHIH